MTDDHATPADNALDALLQRSADQALERLTDPELVERIQRRLARRLRLRMICLGLALIAALALAGTALLPWLDRLPELISAGLVATDVLQSPLTLAGLLVGALWWLTAVLEPA